MRVYADTSFLVSIYLADTHTPEAERRLWLNPVVWLTPLHVAEWTLAIEQHVFRRALSQSEADLYYQRFDQHRDNAVWSEVPMPEAAFEHCSRLGRKFGSQLGPRTLDTLHVACALELKADQFWTFDERQAKLARAAGLKTR